MYEKKALRLCKTGKENVWSAVKRQNPENKEKSDNNKPITNGLEEQEY